MPKRHKLVRLVAVLLVMAVVTFSALFVVPTRSVKADAGDNYPTQWKNAAMDTVVDTWHEWNRECTSWASWALHDRNGYEIPFHDNASGWGADATAIGFPPNNTPAVGAIAWWAAYAPGASQWGHVAWVSAVDADGGITIEQYNADYTGTYSTAYYATSSPQWPSGFIHFNDIGGSVDSDGYFHGIPPNGAVIENHDGGLHKYVALGGSLFWIPEDGSVWDYVNQMENLFPTGTFHNIVWMHDSDIHTIEFGYPSGGREHPPGDNSFFYERGSPTQYVVQYGDAFSIGSTDEVLYLGGQNKAIMVPATNIAGRLSGTPTIPNDVVLSGLNEPYYYHVVNSAAFKVDNMTVLDCITTVKHGAVQRVPESLLTTWRNQSLLSTDITHCSFPPNWALYGPGGAERWWIDGANPYTRHLYVSPLALRCRLGSVPTEVQLPDTTAINSPVQGNDLDCPNGSLVRITSTGEVFQVWNSVLHYVPWQATLSCLTGGHPERVIDIDAAVVATTPRGDWAQCSLEGKLIQSPSGSVDYVVNGARHHILTWAVVNCLEGRRNTGDPVPVDQQTFDSYPDSGSFGYCPYEDDPGYNFVQEQGSDIVWLVGPAAGPPGSKRHAGTLCVPDPYTTTIKAAHVFVVPAGETAGLTQGPDWWPTSQDCQSLPS